MTPFILTFKAYLTISMVLEDFLLLHFLTVHPYFYQSIFVFTRPNDGWTGLCIKLCCLPWIISSSLCSCSVLWLGEGLSILFPADCHLLSSQVINSKQRNLGLTQESLRMVTARVLVVLSGSFTSQIDTGPTLT